MNNRLSAIEHVAPAVLDELHGHPERFCFDDQPLPDETTSSPDRQLLFMMGVVIVPVETATDFLVDNSAAYIDHKSYAVYCPNQPQLGVRFTVCHPPKPVGRNVSAPALEALETSYQDIVIPSQQTVLHPNEQATLDHLRSSDLFKPQRYYTAENGGYYKSQSALLGGLALYAESDNQTTISGQLFINKQRLNSVKASLQTNRDHAIDLYRHIITQELPTGEQMQQLVMPRLQVSAENEMQPAAIANVA